MVAALARAEQLLGQAVPITSGYRSPAKQRALWENRASNPYPVAAPGTSMHERGLAVDVPLTFVPRLERVAASAGLCHPFPQADPVHFEVCR
jgi:LAS superfamily LD-carboxypeptidase LdcB